MKHVDKNSIKHFGVCALLSLLGTHGVAVAIGTAVAKEYCDKKSYGHWCWLDILFDILGCVAGLTVHWLIFKSINY